MRCVTCGRPEDEHHAFVAVERSPDGCVCDPGEWLTDQGIPPACAEYVADEPGGYCRTCEHDEQCHARGAT
jgi:hypothetical protein